MSEPEASEIGMQFPFRFSRLRFFIEGAFADGAFTDGAFADGTFADGAFADGAFAGRVMAVRFLGEPSICETREDFFSVRDCSLEAPWVGCSPQSSEDETLSVSICSTQSMGTSLIMSFCFQSPRSSTHSLGGFVLLWMLRRLTSTMVVMTMIVTV